MAPASVDGDAPFLELDGLRVGYDGHVALHDIDLRVPHGQLLCVLGPSGGGKTSLLRAIAGLEEPLGGRIRLAGRDLASVPAHQRDVGLMFQDYALFPHRDVAGNVAFGLRMRGADAHAARERVEALLELVGLPGAGPRSVAQLSGGEQQRVALARALAPQPRLLMLDEPMGSLDRVLRERLPEELRALFVELGLTTIYVTHDQDEALTVADRVVILEAGRLVADGTPEELWQRPPTSWVAGFLGHRNVAPGRLVRGRLETAWGILPGPAGDGPVTVVLRAGGLVVAADGPIRGVVRGRRFRGDHVLVGVDVPGAPLLHVEARGGELPAVGEAVGLAVLPDGVHLIREAGEASSDRSARPGPPTGEGHGGRMSATIRR
jgi:thiamine transport system ATP-binding protein